MDRMVFVTFISSIYYDQAKVYPEKFSSSINSAKIRNLLVQNPDLAPESKKWITLT